MKTYGHWLLPSCSRRWSTRELPRPIILGKQAIDDDSNQTDQNEPTIENLPS
jgi:hypothetical protein